MLIDFNHEENKYIVEMSYLEFMDVVENFVYNIKEGAEFLTLATRAYLKKTDINLPNNCKITIKHENVI